MRTCVCICCAALLVAGLGCQGFFEQPDDSKPVNLRVENATSSYLDVHITVSELGEPAADSSSSTDPSTPRSSETSTDRPLPADAETEAPAEPPVADATTSGVEEPPAFVTIGLRPAPEPKLTLTDGVVRVFPESFTEGQIECGDLVSLTATLDGAGAAEVLLEGAGSGTLGFDEGSAGPSGERLLLSSLHFECGDTIVIHVADSAALGAGASGKIEVFSAGAAPPPPEVEDASVPTPVGNDEVEIRVSNATASFAQLQVLTGAAAAAASSGTEVEGESDTGVSVRVPPGLLSTGIVECAPRMVLAASIVVPGVAVGEPDTFNQALLSGEGTGTVGFDENSAGTSGQQRLLLEGIHYHCGSVIQVEFTFDGNPGTDQETLGQAEVSQISR